MNYPGMPGYPPLMHTNLPPQAFYENLHNLPAGINPAMAAHIR